MKQKGAAENEYSYASAEAVTKARLLEDRKNVRIAGSSMFFNGVCASSGGVIVALMQEHVGINYTESGMLLSALSIGQLFSCWLVGFLPAKIGLKQTIWIMASGQLLGYALMTGVTAFSLPILFACCLLSYFLIGVAKGATLNVANVMSGKTTEPAKNLNLEHAAFACGSLAAPVGIALIGKNIPVWWAPLLMLTVGGGLLYLVFLCAKLPGKEEKAEAHVKRKTCANENAASETKQLTEAAEQCQKKTQAESGYVKEKSRYAFLHSGKFWLLTLLLFCQQCTEIAVTGWLVTYFKDTGILTGMASQMTVSIVWAAMMVGRLFIAFRLHFKNFPFALMIMGFCCTLTYIALLTAHGPAAALLLLGLFGLGIAGIYPTTIAAAGEMLSNESMGVMLPLAAIGAISMPSLVGAVAERMGIHAGMLVILLSVTGVMVLGGALCLMDKKRD